MQSKTCLDEGEKKRHRFNIALFIYCEQSHSQMYWMLLSEYLELSDYEWIWMTSMIPSDWAAWEPPLLAGFILLRRVRRDFWQHHIVLSHFYLFWYCPSTPSRTPVSLWISPDHPKISLLWFSLNLFRIDVRIMAWKPLNIMIAYRIADITPFGPLWLFKSPALDLNKDNCLNSLKNPLLWTWWCVKLASFCFHVIIIPSLLYLQILF